VSRIEYVKTYQVAYPLEKPLSDSIHYMPVRAALLVELGTDDGEVGIGESAIYGGPASVVETMIHDELAPRILGKDPTKPEWLWQVMMGRSHQHGDGGVLPAAVSGLDIAMWDLMGRKSGLPLYRLLGATAIRYQPTPAPDSTRRTRTRRGWQTRRRATPRQGPVT